MLARFAAWAGLVCWLTPALAGAQPLNLADPTPRTIRVEFEISLDPLAVGQTYSESVDAQYTVTGNIGTVVIPRAVYESAIQTQNLDYFGSMLTWSLVSGSASDFTLDIDLATLEVGRCPSYLSDIDHVPRPTNGNGQPGPEQHHYGRVCLSASVPGIPLLLHHLHTRAGCSVRSGHWQAQRGRQGSPRLTRYHLE